MKIIPTFKWYDAWIGLFFDKSKKRVYFFPVPMLGLIFDYNKPINNIEMEERDCCVNACPDERPCCEGSCDCKSKREERQPGTQELIMGHEKARPLAITQKDFGYVVEVGCQTFCIEKLDSVLAWVDKYLHTPEEVEKQWRKGTLKF